MVLLSISVNKPDFLIGVSASSAIMFEEILEDYGASLKNFGKGLRENKKNFYWFRKNHFPHNDIYRESIQKVVGKYETLPKKTIPWKILVSETSRSFYNLKCFLSSFIMIFHKTNIASSFCKLIKIKTKEISSENNLSSREIIKIILGSSTLWPFIRPQFYKNKLLLEGGLIRANYGALFKKYNKSLVINPYIGKTRIIGKQLHIFSSTKGPLNILDYTNEKKIYELYNQGKREAKIQIEIIKDYLKKVPTRIKVLKN